MSGRRFPATALVPDRSILLISPVKAGYEDRIQASFPAKIAANLARDTYR